MLMAFDWLRLTSIDFDWLRLTSTFSILFFVSYEFLLPTKNQIPLSIRNAVAERFKRDVGLMSLGWMLFRWAQTGCYFDELIGIFFQEMSIKMQNMFRMEFDRTECPSSRSFLTALPHNPSSRCFLLRGGAAERQQMLFAVGGICCGLEAKCTSRVL